MSRFVTTCTWLKDLDVRRLAGVRSMQSRDSYLPAGSPVQHDGRERQTGRQRLQQHASRRGLDGRLQASVLRAPTWAQERFSWEHCRARRFAQTPQSHQLQGELGKCTWTICKHMASFDEFGLLLSLCSFDSVKCNSFNSFDKPKRWEIKQL